MKCSDCGKEIEAGKPVVVGEHYFCNNLCRMLWTNKNPGFAPQQSRSIFRSTSAPEEQTAVPVLTESRTSGIRIVFGLIWFVVFYLLTCAFVGGIAGTIAGVQNPEQASKIGAIAGQTAVQKYGLIILIGNAVLVLLATLGGILPGTKAQRKIRKHSGSKGPFGPVVSIILALVLLGISFLPMVVASAVMSFSMKSTNQALTAAQIGDMLKNNGFMLGIGIIVAAAITIPLMFFFVWLRKGPKVSDYFAFSPVKTLELMKWLLITLAIVGASDLLAFLLKKPIMPEMLIAQYNSARFVPLLFFAIVIAAPVYEEFLFRGFAFRGLLGSKAGAIGAVMITGLIWSVIHLQYDIARIFGIFVIGVVIGLARLNTKSIYPSIAMHSLINLVAFIEMAIISGKMG